MCHDSEPSCDWMPEAGRAPPMNLTYEEFGDVLVIRAGEKRLDASKAPAFLQQVSERVKGGHQQLVLDLSQVNFVDSTGLGAIVTCRKRLGPRGRFAIAGAQGAVARLFSLTRMDKVFPLSASVSDALGHIEELNRQDPVSGNR